MGSEAEVCADEQVIPTPSPLMCANQSLIRKVLVEGDKEEEAAAAAAAGPATPEAEEKGGGEHHNLKHHHFSSPPPLWGNYNQSESGLETPKDTLFDSFAPASDRFLLAPHHRKYREESRNHVVRRLDFTKDLTFTWSCDEQQEEEEKKEEDRMFEIVYGTIMDAILAEQQQPTYRSGGSSGTPKSAPFLNGIADTCPAPPIKSTRKHRFIDKEICKKLEF